MKILLIHSDYLQFEPKQKAIKNAEESGGPVRVEECLVVFTAVEKMDESNPEQAALGLAAEVKKVADEVSAKRIVLYPYAHLSKDLASPTVAMEVMKEAEKHLRKSYDVSRAPFGWYKSFEISCKGHPLSELSREFGPEHVEALISESLKEEEKLKSTWYILEPNGKLSEIKKERNKITGFDFVKHKNLEKFAKYEIAKQRVYEKEPPHIKLMRKLEIADFEPGSDPGNLRFYPKGILIKGLLEQWIADKVVKYGAMMVDTPLMYDFEHPALKDYLNRFPARQYVVESTKKKFFLRFSACFGQFLTNSRMTISYKLLPLKMYELARSFRLEKSGELTGLKRLRAFTMPDMHTLCKDMTQSKKEFEKQFKLCMECMNELEIDDYETGIRFTEEFWKDNKNFVKALTRLVKKPVLIEVWSFRYAYFDPKFEFNFIDALDKASALSTVQVDHENADRYGISFVDKDGKLKKPKILHCSPSGGIERCMYTLMERAYMKDPKKAVFPLWLSPTQVRICPVNDSFIKDAEKIVKEIEKKGVRVDIDDRAESISRKVRDAEMEWTPIIVVIGEKEKKSGKLAVRFRVKGRETKQMTAKEIVNHIKKETKGRPFRQLSLPRKLSKRPIFVG